MEEGNKQLSSNQNWRVKVYLLEKSGNWEDCGSGTLDIVREVKSGEELDFLRVTNHNEANKSNSPAIQQERLKKLKGDVENEKCILHLPISVSNQFDKQGDTIISWVDNSLGEEIALSFLDPAITKETWRAICAKLGRNPMGDRKNQYNDLEKLLVPTVENLGQIKNELEIRKEAMVCAILENKSFLEKLYQIFRDLEDLESLENLHIIHDIIKMLSTSFKIFKANCLIVFSEDVGLLEILLSDEFYLLVFGALEYDSNIPESARPRYRDFLSNRSIYKQVVDFKDESILRKIHLNYRISYLKDSVISSIIDDPLTNQFNPISYHTNHEIFDHIMSNDQYIDELFTKLTTNLEDSIGFFYELTQMVKTMVQADERVEYCRKLVKKNVFIMITQAFAALNAVDSLNQIANERKNILRINLVDILSFIIQLELNSFIEFLRSSTDSKLMIEGIISNLFYGDQGLQIQTGELIKYLIDVIHERKNEILDIFYDSFMPAFVEHYRKLENSEMFYSFVQQFMEILIHCIKSHGYRIRYYIIHHKLLHKLYPGFQTREKSLHLALIRLIKNIALSKDEFLIKYVTNNNLLDDIFDVYLNNARKNNLINSSCLEFFDILRKENIKKLIIEFVQRFRDRITQHGLERFFEKLFMKYDQINEDANREQSQELVEPANGVRLPVPNNNIAENFENYNSRELNYMEDEDYFEAEDDENEAPKTQNQAQIQVTVPVPVPAEVKEVSNENSKVLPEQPPQQTNTILNDQQLKSSRDSIQKMKDKIASKKQEAEEDNKFIFGNKAKSRPTTTERPLTMINIQFNLHTDNNGQEKDGEEVNNKRPGGDLSSDEELKEGTKIDPQKKIKF